MPRLARIAAALAVAITLLGPWPDTRAQPPAVGRYIVVFHPDVADPAGEANDLARAHGLTLRHVYAHALKGFAAEVPQAALDGLARNPRVAYVEADRPAQLLAQTLPTGVDRVDADLDPTARIDGADQRVEADVAIIDTGVDLDHPDLNVYAAGGKDCAPTDGKTNFFDDDHGHGTHVAGIAGALDNGASVVGVAPGVRLWPVKVWPGVGSGTWGDVICGIDWVTANAGAVEVANVSIADVGTDAPSNQDCTNAENDALHQAICNSVKAGITYVVGAGNSSADAGGYIPATYEEVIAVSALADFDGKPGALSSGSFLCANFTFSRDDSFACMSNFGADVDLAAPGVNIVSTAVGGGTTTKSGTSMAAPHVAGAAALYLATHPGASPAGVKSALQANSSTTTQTLNRPADPDGSYEPILNANFGGATAPTPTPTPTPVATATATPTAMPAETSTPTPTAVATATPTATPIPTDTATPTAVPTSAPLPTATSAPAPTAPVISNVRVTSITKTSATVSWKTDVPATSTVWYGITTIQEASISDPTLTTTHSIQLTGLQSRTPYVFVVESTANGLTSQSAESGFRTR